MRRQSVAVAAVTALAFVVGSQGLLADVALYTTHYLFGVYDMGVDPPPLGSSVPASLNDSGDFVGSVADRIGPSSRAFAYVGGTYMYLPLLPGDTDAFGNSINNLGQIAGTSLAGWSSELYNWTSFRGFVYSNGVLRDVGSLGTSGSTFVTGINDAGQVVGYSSGGAFRTGPSGLINPAADNICPGGAAFGINASGQVVGQTNTGHAFVTSPSGICTADALLHIPSEMSPFDYSWGDAINNLGHVAGRYLGSGNQPTLAFFFDGVNIRDLGTLPECDLSSMGATVPRSINDLDQIVGTCPSNSGNVWFLYDPAHGMRALNSLLSGATLGAAVLNNHGAMVGIGCDANNNCGTLAATPIPNNTEIGSNIAVSTNSLGIVFSAVTEPGITQIDPIDPAAIGEVPGGFAVLGATAFRIQSTAAFAGPVTLSLTVPISISESDFASLAVLHNDNGVLVDVTAALPARDFATRTIYATTTSFSPFYIVRASSHIAPLFDTTRPHKAGSSIPVKLRLLSSSNANLSSANIAITTRDLRRIDGSVTLPVSDAGRANSGGGFRFDAGLEGYIFNLSTKGLVQGSYLLSFYVGPSRLFFYTVRFQVG